jgi:hypothetical protein
LKKSKIEFASYGVIIGAVVGIFTGFGELYFLKKSIVDQFSFFIIATNVLVFIIIGFFRGIDAGERAFIFSEIGRNDCSLNYFKDGRYWVGVCDWTDNRDKKKYQLLTARSNTEYIVSAIDRKVVLKHSETSASQKSIIKLHRIAIEFVFNTIAENYYSNESVDVSDLFPKVES